jgi:hypothetical protein
MKRSSSIAVRGLVLAAAALALCTALPAQADVTFGASVTNANGQLQTTLNWSTNPVASSCTAAGHPSWTGTKPASGSQVLPPITLSGSYTLTLTCTRPGDSTLTIEWTPPTKNTDGTNYTNPAGFIVKWATGGEASVATAPTTQTRLISDPAAAQTVVTGVAPGDWFVGAQACNNASPQVCSTFGTKKADGTAAHKVLTGTVQDGSSITLTINPIPNPPTGLTVQ